MKHQQPQYKSDVFNLRDCSLLEAELCADRLPISNLYNSSITNHTIHTNDFPSTSGWTNSDGQDEQRPQWKLHEARGSTQPEAFKEGAQGDTA